VFTKWAEQVGLDLVKPKAIAAALGPHQFGGGVRNGVVIAGLLHQYYPVHWVQIMSDVANAFNSLERKAMFELLHKEQGLQPIWSVTHALYDMASPLWMKDAQKRCWALMYSSRGVRQGGKLSALLFCLCMKHLHVNAFKGHTKATASIVAIADDVAVIGEQIPALKIANHLADNASNLGLHWNATKDTVFLRKGEPSKELKSFMHDHTTDPANPLKTSNNAVIHGIPYAIDHETTGDMYLAIVQKELELRLEAINSVGFDKHQGFRILTQSICSSYCHAMSIIHPLAAAKAHKWIDDQLTASASKIFDLQPGELDWTRKTQLFLPLNRGGFDLTRHEDIAPIAWISSVARGLPELYKRLPASEVCVGSRLQNDIATCIAMLTVTHASVTTPQLKKGAAAFCDFYCLPANKTAAQTLGQTLRKALHTARRAELLRHYKKSTYDVARLNEALAFGSSFAISSDGSTPCSTMSDDTFSIMGRLRLGTHTHPNTISHLSTQCSLRTFMASANPRNLASAANDNRQTPNSHQRPATNDKRHTLIHQTTNNK
jgi:hypothetical protein